MANIDMVAFQKAACVKSQQTEQIPDMFVLQNNFLYVLDYAAQSNENLVQQSSAKIQECKNFQTKAGNTTHPMVQSFSGQETTYKEKV